VKQKLILFTFSLIHVLGLSQHSEKEVRDLINNAPEGQLVVEASRMLQEDYYYFSEILVDKLLTLKPESSNYNYRKGFIELYSRNDFEKAIQHLEKGKLSVDKNYDMYSAKEKSAPTDVYYHLGKAYHLDEQLDKAVENYNLFIASTRKGSVLVAQAKLGITQCEVAKKLIATPKSAKVKNLNAPVNTEYPEYSPVVSLDGKSLYFTSRRPWENGETDSYRDPKLNNFPEDIYVSILERAEWVTPTRIDINNPQVNEATIAVSVDERRIYVYQDITGGGDIYYSDFKGNKFQLLEQVDLKGINSEYWETHCAVTPDGKNIYFVSERPGGYGGRDIYRLVKLADGTWSEPINLGPTINTANDEESPFLAIDNKTMYFASNGPTSMGGFDIFVSVRDDQNVWSTPINLGYPINSTGDDLFYTTTMNGYKGFLSSFRKNGNGEKDIYEIENDYMGVQNVIVLTGNIHTLGDEVLHDSAHVVLKCKSCLESYMKVPLRARDGAFVQTLERCSEYEIIFMKNETEMITSETFNTSCNKKYEEIYKEAYIGTYLLAETIFDKETGEPIAGVKVQIRDGKTGQIVEELVSNEQGKIYSNLLKNKYYGDSIHYVMTYDGPKYLKITKEFKQQLGRETKFENKVYLDRNKVGLELTDIVQINPIYFDLDESKIRPDAEIELNKIVKFMNDNPTVKIELGSHTDCRATKGYNLTLSNARARASAAYVKKRISNPNRIYGKGYGESKLVNDCGCEGEVISDCSEDEHQANRRTEFVIVK